VENFVDNQPLLTPRSLAAAALAPFA